MSCTVTVWLNSGREVEISNVIDASLPETAGHINFQDEDGVMYKFLSGAVEGVAVRQN